MTVRPYPEYRDTGAMWLGKVPAHWVSRRLGFYLAERREKVSDRDFAPLSVTKSGVVPQLDTAAKSDDGENRKLVRKGDFAINGRSDRKGSSGLSRVDGSVSLINIVLQAVEPIDMRYVHHLLKSGLFQEEFYRFGKGIVADLWSTNYSEMRNIELAVPPLHEQSAITAFLDRETGKIDALVAEQERLIALLKETRQAVISRAVTKGLNPNDPMKDSGVEWLGEVPAHWDVKRLKHVAAGITVGVVVTPSQYYVDAGVPALRSQNVREMKVSSDGLVYFSSASNQILRKSMLSTDDLIAVRTGQPGVTAVVPSELNGANCIDLILIKKSRRMCSRFVAYVMNSGICKIQYDQGSGGAIQQHFNIETAGNLIFALPHIFGQVAIVEFLDKKTGDLDRLQSEATRATTLLRERRAALISAAVTGKIDVRNHAPATQAEAA